MASDDTPKELPQHPLVDRLKPDPAQVARKVVTLVGLPGKSDRPGYQRLYLTPKLDYYVEFPLSAMVHTETVPADQSPIANHEATSVTLARDATIHYIWATAAQAMDEFDLDVRLGTPGAAMAAIGIPTRVATCFPDGSGCRTCDGTCDNTCLGPTCHTCATCETRCGQVTCDTCETRCGQATCLPTCQTCETQCNQATCAPTCQTCNTQCGQATCATCNTCQTQCNQATCHTCQTRCGQATCFTCHTCVDTCIHTCATCQHPHCAPPQ
jgi:hypothetical protein